MSLAAPTRRQVLRRIASRRATLANWLALCVSISVPVRDVEAAEPVASRPLAVQPSPRTVDLHWRYPAPSDREARLESVYALASGGGTSVALSSAAPNGQILRSRSGILWDIAPVPAGDTLADVAWGAGRWVAVGRSQTTMLLLGSAEGVTWERTLLPSTANSATLTEVHFGEGKFVAIGFASWPARSTSPVVVQSTDGIHWTPRVEPPPGPATASGAFGIASGNGRFLRLRWTQIDQFGQPQSSTNAIDWQPIPHNAPPLRSLAFGNGAFVAFGYGSKVYRSTDGLSWEEIGPAPLADTEFLDTLLRFAGGRFYACSETTLFTSEDGRTWSSHPLPAEVRMLDIAGDGEPGGLLLAGARLGRLMPGAAAFANGGVIYQVGLPPTPEIRLGSMLSTTAGTQSLAAQAPPGTVLELQQSTDLRDWIPVATGTSTDGLFDLAIPASSAKGQVFYRTRSQPAGD